LETYFATASEITWEAPPEPLLLPSDEVHVWRLPLDEKTDHVERLLDTLAPDEVERANGFYFPKDRERFVIAHGMTRAILSDYLKVMPNELRFRYGPFGKPTLEGSTNKSDLRFNLSHSASLALLAVTRARELGVDLEYQEPKIASEDIAKRFFSGTEVKSLISLPKEMQTDGFFKCWTRKEAYIKAIGEGLSFPLDQFSVSVLPSELPGLLEVVGNPMERTKWAFWDLAVSSRYAAALVIEGSNVRLRCFK
jgi:4'-phosphopantetheinyl transferase